MNALLISEYGALNGGEFSFLAALPKLQTAGFKFTAAILGYSDFASLLEKNGVRIEHYSFRDDDQIRKPQETIREQLSDLIEQLHPDIVHANSLAAARILGPVTSKSKAVGLGYLRDIIKLSRKATEDVSMLDRIVAVSQATADFHIAAGMPAEKITVIHNGVDLQRFRPVWLDTEPARPGKKKVCLCIGQIGMRKGLELSLQMLAQAFKQVPDSELWIVGERHSQKLEAIEYEQKLHAYAKEHFAEGSVKWLGRRTDIPNLMQQADVLVHAAKQEPLGRVLLESAASGLPIVTTNVGGTPEILRELGDELMHSPDNFDLMVPVVVELLTDDERHREISKALRKIAEQYFSADRAGDDLVRCYQAAFNGASGFSASG